MKIKIFAIADSFKDFQPLVDHYEKMLWKSVKIIKIKPSKGDNFKRIIEEDTKKIIKFLEKDKNFKILLSKDWEILSTEEIVDLTKTNFHLTFVIGWPYGLDEDKLNKVVDKKISFWRITMSHLVVLLVLLEQLYRIKTIIEWKKYHY
jgi:23S rRNA (pseudouridine1915-N3)-methyltransferase